jgi:hypothetical protein
VSEDFERFVKMIYKNWKNSSQEPQGEHPDEEVISCFLEGRLGPEEAESLREHLARCPSCMECLAVNLKLEETSGVEVPEELTERVKRMLAFELKPSALEIILKLKERALEIINVTGDVLVGREVVAAPVLRSRAINEFQGSVTIFKDFDEIRAEIKIENKGGAAFNLTVIIKHRLTQKVIKDLRVSLLREGLELESRLTEPGFVTFEQVSTGLYAVEISRVAGIVASLAIDIRR